MSANAVKTEDKQESRESNGPEIQQNQHNAGRGGGRGGFRGGRGGGGRPSRFQGSPAGGGRGRQDVRINLILYHTKL